MQSLTAQTRARTLRERLSTDQNGSTSVRSTGRFAEELDPGPLDLPGCMSHIYDSVGIELSNDRGLFYAESGWGLRSFLRSGECTTSLPRRYLETLLRQFHS